MMGSRFISRLTEGGRVADPHLWLVCGMPTTGKTTFGNWLRDHRGYLHLDLESRDCLETNGFPSFWPERIWNLDRPGLSEFVTYLRSLGREVILTWAFHTDLIPFVRDMVADGIEPWWFEGDRLAARTRHAGRGQIIQHGIYSRGAPDLEGWDRYVASLVARWAEIEPIVGPNIVRTLDADGGYLHPELILAAMQARRMMD